MQSFKIIATEQTKEFVSVKLSDTQSIVTNYLSKKLLFVLLMMMILLYWFAAAADHFLIENEERKKERITHGTKIFQVIAWPTWSYRLRAVSIFKIIDISYYVFPLDHFQRHFEQSLSLKHYISVPKTEGFLLY